MPNWCNNSIVINGPADKIRVLWDAATTLGEEKGLLSALCPIPTELSNTDDHLDWRVQNWGTKWDVDAENMYFEPADSDHAQISGGFDTAWAPPVAAFRSYANDNTDVSIDLKYFEPGMSFIGQWNTNGVDKYWDDINDLVTEEDELDDPVLIELFEYFGVRDCYATIDDIDSEE
jgi:hypothetical protein